MLTTPYFLEERSKALKHSVAKIHQLQRARHGLKQFRRKKVVDPLFEGAIAWKTSLHTDFGEDSSCCRQEQPQSALLGGWNLDGLDPVEGPVRNQRGLELEP